MFTSNLKMFREQNNMSQRDIADKLNMTQQGYFRWENGTAFPNEEKLVLLCEILKCTPNDLLGIRKKYKKIMNRLDD